MQKRVPPKLGRRLLRALWAVAGFFAIGYFPTVLVRLSDFRAVAPTTISLGLAAAAIFPIGGMAPTRRRAIWRGLGLGIVAGVGLWSALSVGTDAHPVHVLPYPLMMVALCTAVAVLFQYLTQKRIKQMEDGW